MLLKFARLPRPKKVLLLRAAWLLSVAVVELRLRGFDSVRRHFQRIGKRNSYSVEDIRWAVSAASRRIPLATCLPQALVGEHLLRSSGFAADFRLGVCKQPTGIDAHAWVELDGRVVIGAAADPAQFSELALERV